MNICKRKVVKEIGVKSSSAAKNRSEGKQDEEKLELVILLYGTAVIVANS